MLLYWAMFTIGYFAGTILTFRLFAAKKPEEEEQANSRQPSTFVLINNQKQIVEKTPEVPALPFTPQSVKES